jgi:hypothetical protein
MKTLITLLCALFMLHTSFAQKTVVRHETAPLGGGVNPASVVEIENAGLKDTEKMWSSYLKDTKGKLNKSDDVYFLDNAMISSISNDTLDIYSTLKLAGKTVIITMAVNSNGTFISNSSGSQTAVDRFLIDFAISVKKELVNEELSAAKKVLDSRNREFEKLESENKKLEKDIASMKNKISDNERNIKSNNDKLKQSQSEIEEQQKVVSDLEQKFKNIE